MGKTRAPAKLPVTSAKRRSDAIQSVLNGWPEPPIALRAGDMEHWKRIVVCRMPQAWAQLDLEQAAQLARVNADMHAQQKQLAREGYLRKDGTMNPRVAVCERLNRLSMSWTRLLQLHAVVNIGERGKGAGVSKAESEAAAGAVSSTQQIDANSDKANLLARPPRLQ